VEPLLGHDDEHRRSLHSVGHSEECMTRKTTRRMEGAERRAERRGASHDPARDEGTTGACG
jgi:hypothetical protein